MMKLVFFTDSYPFGGLTEHSFIKPELQLLSDRFTDVLFIPNVCCGELDWSGNYSNFLVDKGIIQRYKSKSLLLLFWHLFSLFVLNLVRKDFKRIKSRSDIFSLLRYIDKAFWIKQYIEQLIQEGVVDPYNTVFYSFWFSEVTFSLALLSEKYPISFYTRAHGYDLYDERVIYRSHSIREYTLSKIKKVCACSKVGMEYLKKHYPAQSCKIDVSYLGCSKLYNLMNPEIIGSTITFFTCARMYPVKRMPMAFKILACLSEYYKSISFNWIIAGDGEDMEKLKILIANLSPMNLQIVMLGSKTNDEVHHILSSTHIDWNFMLSESEGLSISVCEATAYGIPSILTNVGGLGEIIQDDYNGLLLSANPTFEELILKIDKYIAKGHEYEQLRRNAYKTWKENYNSVVQRKRFVERLTM